MMTFYAAAGSYQIRNEDGKDMPYIMRLGKLQPVSIPEFSIWSMLLWDVLTHDELRKKYFEKMEEVKLDPSGFEKALEMLVKRKLIIKGVGYTGADALYNMLYDMVRSHRPVSAMAAIPATATSHSLSRNRTNNWKEVSSHDRNNLFRPEEWHDVQPSQAEPRQRSPRACC